MSTFFPPQILDRLSRQRRGAPIPPAHTDEDAYADAATVERNLQRVGSQPYVGTGIFHPQEQASERADRIMREGTTDWNLTEGHFDPRTVDMPNPDALARVSRAGQPQPDATIQAESAPLDYSRAGKANILQSTINEGLNSPNAANIRTAMEARRDAAAGQPRGFWGKVGRVFEGIGEGAAQGALRGGGLGMVIGGIGGGVSPKWADKLSDEVEFERRYPENVQGENLRFRQQQAQRQQEAELRQQANFERQVRLTEAQIENMNRDDLFNRQREARIVAENEAKAQQAAEKEAFDRRQAIAGQQQKVVGEQNGILMPTLGDFWAKPEARALASRNQGGYVANLDPSQPAYRLPSPQQEDVRKLQQVTNEARARGAADLEKRIKMLPLELQEYASKERIKASFDTERDRIDLSGVPTIGEFERAKSEAKEFATRADNARKAKDTAEADKLQAQADDAYGRASAYHSAMMESGGYEDNSSGGWVGIRRKPMTRKGGVAGGSSVSSSKPAYIKTVRGKDGKMYGVTKQNPDGSVEVEPIQ